MLEPLVGISPMNLHKAFNILSKTKDRKVADYYFYYICEWRDRVLADNTLDPQTASQYRQFYDNWDVKKDRLMSRFGILDNQETPPIEHEPRHQETPQSTLQLAKLESEERAKQTKMEILERQGRIMTLQQMTAQAHAEQTEKLMGLDDLLKKDLQIFKEANKELQTAYTYDTKTTTNNVKTTAVVAGAVGGTVAVPVPIGGTVVGGGIGYTLGKIVDKIVNGRTKTQIAKMNEATKE